MFRTDLLLIIKRHYSVYIAIGLCHAFMLTGCWQYHLDNCDFSNSRAFPKSVLVAENFLLSNKNYLAFSP